VAHDARGAGRAVLIDCDGTLYPNGGLLDARIAGRVTETVARFLGVSLAEALRIRTEEFGPNGGSFYNLVDLRGVDPTEYFGFLCCAVTDPRRFLAPDPLLRAALLRCQAPIYMFTNAPLIHGERVAEALGVRDLFEGIFCIEWAEWIGKPDPATARKALAELRLDAGAVTHCDDVCDALDSSRTLGLRTVLVGEGTRPTEHARAATLHDLATVAPWLYD